MPGGNWGGEERTMENWGSPLSLWCQAGKVGNGMMLKIAWKQLSQTLFLSKPARADRN